MVSYPTELERPETRAPDSARNAKSLQELKQVVGARYVLSSPASTRCFRTGFRFGEGAALGATLFQLEKALNAVDRNPHSMIANWRILDSRGAEYPAEPNVGHLYFAKPALANHYRALDSSNSFNPGIGHISKCAHWK